MWLAIQRRSDSDTISNKMIPRGNLMTPASFSCSMPKVILSKVVIRIKLEIWPTNHRLGLTDCSNRKIVTVRTLAITALEL